MLLWDSWQTTCWPGPVVNRPIFLAEEGKPKNQQNKNKFCKSLPLRVEKQTLHIPTTAKNKTKSCKLLKVFERAVVVCSLSVCMLTSGLVFHPALQLERRRYRNVDFIEHQYYRLLKRGTQLHSIHKWYQYLCLRDFHVRTQYFWV